MGALTVAFVFCVGKGVLVAVTVLVGSIAGVAVEVVAGDDAQAITRTQTTSKVAVHLMRLPIALPPQPHGRDDYTVFIISLYSFVFNHQSQKM